MVEYVCGFLFAEGIYGPRVTLIHKNRPAWQAGKLNGVGGKIELGETPLQAMHREFQEEAGVAGLVWVSVAVLAGSDFSVDFFCAWCEPTTFAGIRSCTDEELCKMHVAAALNCDKLIPNLRVLIPLALDQTGIRKPVLLRDDRGRPV